MRVGRLGEIIFEQGEEISMRQRDIEIAINGAIREAERIFELGNLYGVLARRFTYKRWDTISGSDAKYFIVIVAPHLKTLFAEAWAKEGQTVTAADFTVGPRVSYG